MDCKMFVETNFRMRLNHKIDHTAQQTNKQTNKKSNNCSLLCTINYSSENANASAK